MKTDELIEVLTEEIERIRADAEQKMGALHEAIRILEGKPAVSISGASNEGAKMDKDPSVTEMLLKAAEKMAGENIVVLDHAPLKVQAGALFPDQTDKIGRGIYTAVKQLIKAGKFVRTPGGFCLPKYANFTPGTPPQA